MTYEIENLNIAPTSKNTILMGDSITEFWKQINPNFFEQHSILNRGISGQTTSQMMLRFGQDVIDLKPKMVIILAGINDIAENLGPISIESIFENICTMVELAKENKIEVVLCSVLPANHFYWNPKIKPVDKILELNGLIKNYSDFHKITFIDYYNAMIDDEKGLPKKYADDGVHPNLVGYQKMETLFWEQIPAEFR